MGSTTLTKKKLRVSAFGPTPKTPRAALTQARKLLAEEGRWRKGGWFETASERDNPDNPLCGSWGVCAMGAVGAVIEVKTFKRTLRDWKGDEQGTCILGDTQLGGNALYRGAERMLNVASKVLSDGMYDNVISFNDHGGTGLIDVLNVFDLAIEIAVKVQKAEQAARKATLRKVLAEVSA